MVGFAGIGSSVRVHRRTGSSLAGILLSGACAFLLWARVCLAQNVATDPGFETGSTSGWAPFGAPTISVQSTQVHSGTYAAIVQNRTATWNGASQSFAGVLQSGQS